MPDLNDLLPAPFDGYEVALCAELEDAAGERWTERVDLAADLEDLLEGYPSSLMFTVYGHFPGGGVHAFADSVITDDNPYEDARAYAVRLAQTIAGSPQQVLDMTFDAPEGYQP